MQFCKGPCSAFQTSEVCTPRSSSKKIRNRNCVLTLRKASMSLARLRVDELRKRLKEKGLQTSGTKQVLVARLQEAIDKEDREGHSKGVSDAIVRDTEAGSGEKKVEEEKKLDARAVENGRTDTKKGGRKQVEEPKEVQGKNRTHKVAESKDAKEEGKLVKRGSNLDGLRAADQMSFDERMKIRKERFAEKAKGSTESKKKGGDTSGKRRKIGSIEVDEEEEERRRKRAAKFGLGDKSAKQFLKEDWQKAREKAKIATSKAKTSVTEEELKTANGRSDAKDQKLSEDQKKALARKERFSKRTASAKKKQES